MRSQEIFQMIIDKLALSEHVVGGFHCRKKNICYNKIKRNQENSGESHAVDKSWRQVERLTEAGAVLQETLLKYCKYARRARRVNQPQ